MNEEAKIIKLSKFKKSELIKFLIEKDNKYKISSYENKIKAQIKDNDNLRRFISKFREMYDKFGIEKGTYIFVEYRSEIGDIRTCAGYLIKESKKHISVKIKDSKGYYYYHIRKKMINGIKEYRN